MPLLSVSGGKSKRRKELELLLTLFCSLRVEQLSETSMDNMCVMFAQQLGVAHELTLPYLFKLVRPYESI